MKVSVLGPAGSYSEVAARAFLETVFKCSSPELLFCSSIENTVTRLFEEDENGRVSDCAVIPIENSIEGAVGVSMDLLLEKEVSVISEFVLPVRHCLLVSEKIARTPGFSPDKITVVYSHPQGRYQCRTYIQEHLKNAVFIETDSTSKAALHVADMSKDNADAAIGAAIASAEAGKAYGLKTIDCGIQDNSNNSTRFLLLIRPESPPDFKAHTADAGSRLPPEFFSQTESGNIYYKTSIAVSPFHDRPGALFRILEPFYENGINLTRIESRPSKKSLGEYHFYIDFEGCPSDKKVDDSLKLISGRSARLKILGTYGRILPDRQ
ncbi:MAG: prephenate dehydratase [Methanosarcinales archaeon]|jgi:prephenate dehydratase|nr:prephenate dehydratase [Methanosarcinales archaeon]